MREPTDITPQQINVLTFPDVLLLLMANQ